MTKWDCLTKADFDRIRAEVYDPIQRIYERRLADENRRIQHKQINRAFVANLIEIDNARHRRQN